MAGPPGPPTGPSGPPMGPDGRPLSDSGAASSEGDAVPGGPLSPDAPTSPAEAASTTSAAETDVPGEDLPDYLRDADDDASGTNPDDAWRTPPSMTPPSSSPDPSSRRSGPSAGRSPASSSSAPSPGEAAPGPRRGPRSRHAPPRPPGSSRRGSTPSSPAPGSEASGSSESEPIPTPKVYDRISGQTGHGEAVSGVVVGEDEHGYRVRTDDGRNVIVPSATVASVETPPAPGGSSGPSPRRRPTNPTSGGGSDPGHTPRRDPGRPRPGRPTPPPTPAPGSSARPSAGSGGSSGSPDPSGSGGTGSAPRSRPVAPRPAAGSGSPGASGSRGGSGGRRDPAPSTPPAGGGHPPTGPDHPPAGSGGVTPPPGGERRPAGPPTPDRLAAEGERLSGDEASRAVEESGVDAPDAPEVASLLNNDTEGFRANRLIDPNGPDDESNQQWGIASGIYRLGGRAWTIFYPDRGPGDTSDPEPIAVPLDAVGDEGGDVDRTPPAPTPLAVRRRATPPAGGTPPTGGGSGGHGGGTPPPGGGHGGDGGGDHGDGHGDEHGPKQRWWRALKNRKAGVLGGLYSGIYALTVPGPWLNDQMVNRGWGTESNAGRRLRKVVAVAGGMAVRGGAAMVMTGKAGRAYEAAVEGMSDLDFSDVVDWVQDFPEETREKLGEIAEEWNNDHESDGNGGGRDTDGNPPTESVVPDSELPDDIPSDWDLPDDHWTDKQVNDYRALHEAGMSDEELKPIFENPEGPEAQNLEKFFDWVTDTKEDIVQDAQDRGENLSDSQIQKELDNRIEPLEHLEEVSSDHAPDIEAPEAPEGPEATDLDAVEVPEGSGQGITDKIHDIEPGLDGGEYMDIYQDVVDRYGKDGIFEGIETYIDEPTGEVRLYPGEGRWAPGVREFIHEQAEMARQSLEDSNNLEPPQ